MSQTQSKETRNPVRRRSIVALRHKDFRKLWTGQFISQSGSQMQHVAVAWQLYLLTHSPLALGMIGLFRVIPIILFSLFGGMVADTVDRRKLLIITQSVMMCLSLILAVVTWSDAVVPWIIYGVMALAAAATAFDNPARAALIPNLVPPEDLTNAFSLNLTSWQAATIIGPSLAGLIIAWSGVAAVYWIDAISFLAVIIALISMKARPRRPEGGAIGIAALREGLSFVFNTRIITVTMLLDFFATFFGASLTLLPIFAQEILHVGPRSLGLLYAAPPAGAVAAGAVMSLMKGIDRQGPVLLWAVAAYGVSTIIFGMSTWLPLTLIALAGTGAADLVSTVIRQTIRQLVTPDRLRGRMTSVNMIFFMGGPQLGEFEAGVVASLLSPSLAVITGGIGVLIATALASLTPVVRQFRAEGLKVH